MYNKAIMIGKVCSAPQVKTLDSGILVANFRIETDDHSKHYHTVNCYDKTAQSAQHFTEGQVVFVDGKVVTRSYTDKNDQKKYVTTINAGRVASVLEQSNGQLQELGEDEDVFV